MRILIVHQFYLFPGDPGGSRFNEMARLWSAAGHEVTVIAGALNYQTGRVPDRYRGRWVTRERDGAVDVWRCYVPPSYSRSYLGRMWAFLGFTLSALTAAVLAPRPDVVVASSPPLIAALPGWWAARCKGRRVPWVFEMRDLWPESAVAMGVLKEGSLLTRVLYAIESWACRSAARVNALTPGIAESLLKRGLATPDRLDQVPNGGDLDRFGPGPRDNGTRSRLGWKDRFVALYAGAHGRANGLGQLVDAAERLRGRDDILIACVGDGPERVRWSDEASRRGLSNIVFYGPQPKDAMPDLVRAADVGCAVLRRTPTFDGALPNKVFDYMASGKPVLLTFDGASRRLLCGELRAGVYAEPENPDALAVALRSLADHPEDGREMGRRGREWVAAHQSRERLAGRYLEILGALTGGPPAERARPRVRRRPDRSFERALKGAVDRLAGAVGLLLLSPVLLVVALLVRINLGSPILFLQERPGRGGRIFRIAKFRTMRHGTEPDALRLSGLGRMLRDLSLDELPQLWNLVRGDMSLVGPRPLLVHYLGRYTPEQARRHEVKPGITGWAQVNGRNALSWEERLCLDVWYVDHWSLLLDARILVRSVRVVFSRLGTRAPGEATMPEFMGSTARD